MYKLRELKNEDVKHVARIHEQFLDQGIISHMGQNFLESFYNSLISQKSTFTIVVENDGEVVAFATGATDLNSIPRLMISELWRPTLIAVAKKPKIAIKLLQTPFYPSFKVTEDIGEIFSIAVIPAHQRQGLGAKLIERCIKEFEKRGYKRFQLSVRKKMTHANNFYKKLKLRKKASSRFLNEEIIFYGN